MISQISRSNDLENQHVLHINRLPARTTVVPAKRSGVYYKNKEDSDLLQSLNGDWQFNYQPKDCLAHFYETTYEASSWDVIDVPSMWQYRGYGKPSYPNVEYPIPFHPPYVCCENPVGYYRKSFTVPCKRERTVLHFSGVDNAFYVYVNGVFVGFSKGSRIPAEFDVSHVIREGENLIAVKVFTYSDATYLENQDMLLASGIFRDVYLLHTDAVSLWDYRVTTTMNSFTVRASLCFHGEADWRVHMSLDGQCAELDAADAVEHTFLLKEPRLWNAEQPNLYDLTITLLHQGEIAEIHSKRVGIMHTKCEGRHFYVNGSPVYIKGVNRHEHDCENGRAISVALIEKELRMIKDNNLNAVRCAHYNNHPAFYEIASEIGLYVMAEADIETHGCGVTNDQGWLNKHPDWYDAFFDRVSRMLETCKNEPCIFIWSAGNECGVGDNLNRCMQYIKAFDATKAMTYTQVNADERMCPPYSEFVSVGYPALAKLAETKEAAKKPVLLIEYAHAMGNSPGFLQGYQDYVYACDHICGGFVWEFKNHGFKTRDGNVLYGGDFSCGDRYHWYNFCLDGFLTADGTPKPTWHELGEVMAPLYVTFDGKIKLYNTNDFRAVDYLTVKWTLKEDYTALRGGTKRLPPIRPHESDVLELDLSVEHPTPGARYFAELLLFDGDRQISKKQIELPVRAKKLPFVKRTYDATVTQSGADIQVCGADFAVRFAGGLLCGYEQKGRTLLHDTMQFSCFRATTDNDGIQCLEKWFPAWFGRSAEAWNRSFLSSMKYHWEEMGYDLLPDCVVVKTKGKILPDFECLGFDTEITYSILAEGHVLVDIVGRPFGKMPDTLPRVGVVFPTPKDFTRCVWYGRGAGQNYADAHANAHMGLYDLPLSEMNFMFDMPQETGNREDTAFVSVCGKDGQGLSVVGCDAFSFAYQGFTQQALDRAKHRTELAEAAENYLYINYKTRGLGSRSCGPDPEPAFEFKPHDFRFAFTVTANTAEDELLSLARSDFGIKTQGLTDSYTYVPPKKQAEIADCDEG